MQHRAHLFSLRIAHALRESFKEAPYSPQRFSKDLIAGITVGIIAIPLSMALAIASGVAPQYGLYTAMIAGFIIALTGGSRYSISGPTAAFVVILYPIAEKIRFRRPADCHFPLRRGADADGVCPAGGALLSTFPSR